MHHLLNLQMHIIQDISRTIYMQNWDANNKKGNQSHTTHNIPTFDHSIGIFLIVEQTLFSKLHTKHTTFRTPQLNVPGQGVQVTQKTGLPGA